MMRARTTARVATNARARCEGAVRGIARMPRTLARRSVDGRRIGIGIGLGPRVERHTHDVIDEIIDAGRIRTLFQPIVELANGAVVGFEALSRGPAGTALESPLALFEAASAAGRVGELDWLCRTKAMQAAARSNLGQICRGSSMWSRPAWRPIALRICVLSCASCVTSSG